MESIEDLSGLALTDTSSISSSDAHNSGMTQIAQPPSDAHNGDWGMYIPLHKAILKADWEKAHEIISKDKNALSAKINDGGETVIHIAAGVAVATCKNTIFLDKLLEDRELNVNVVDNFNHNPLHRAAIADYAYELVKKYPSLATEKELNFVPLEVIAKTSDAYRSGESYNFYQNFVYSYVPVKHDDLRDAQKMEDIENQNAHEIKFMKKHTNNHFYSVPQRIYYKFWEATLLRVSHIKRLQEDKVKHNNALSVMECICQQVGISSKGISEHYSNALAHAVKNDTYEAVKLILEHFPSAVSYLRVARDNHRNNPLHLVGKLAPEQKLNRVSGAALQMQRELHWFEAVTKFCRPIDKVGKNKNDETPMMIFRSAHKSLRKDGEEWMKKTAESCTIIAALIITIVFAAAITVPGGDDNGKPIYATRPSFIIFAVSDAISLFSSATSLLLFLSVLTARYQDEDFLYNLPKRLILGLATLFLSVTSMMVAFSSTLYIMFGQGKAWIKIPIATLTCLPIASFVTLQLPLLVDLISSTYGNGTFPKRNDPRSK